MKSTSIIIVSFITLETCDKHTLAIQQLRRDGTPCDGVG